MNPDAAPAIDAATTTAPLVPPTFGLSVRAVIRHDPEGTVLLLRRPPGAKHFAGLWEFPGGKLEAGDGYSGYAARALELQRQNTILRSRIADLNSAARIQRYAQQRGMIVPGPDQYTYLHTRRGDALKAARGYTAPIAPTTPSAGSTAATGAGMTNGPTAATGAGL